MKICGMSVVTALLMFVHPALADGPEPGVYEGISEGGQLFVEINGRQFKIEIGAAGCAGSGTGEIADVSKDQWTVTMKDNGMSCTLDVQRQGQNRLNVSERDDCQDFHGFACSFDGYVTR